MMDSSEQKTYQQLQQECAPIDYKEIEMFFARGMLVLVEKGTDILDVALIIQADDTNGLDELIKQGQVIRAHDDHAMKWSQSETQLMAVTAVPWLLVQEIIPEE